MLTGPDENLITFPIHLIILHSTEFRDADWSRWELNHFPHSTRYFDEQLLQSRRDQSLLFQNHRSVISLFFRFRFNFMKWSRRPLFRASERASIRKFRMLACPLTHLLSRSQAIALALLFAASLYCRKAMDGIFDFDCCTEDVMLAFACDIVKQDTIAHHWSVRVAYIHLLSEPHIRPSPLPLQALIAAMTLANGWTNFSIVKGIDFSTKRHSWKAAISHPQCLME